MWEFIIITAIIGGYGMLGFILLGLIFASLLLIDLVFRTHFGRRTVRKYIRFLKDED